MNLGVIERRLCKMDVKALSGMLHWILVWFE